MQGFPGPPADLSQLRSTMQAVEHACSSIQMHMNPTESESVIVSLRQSPMPYQPCRYILENSLLPIARFQAAGAIRDAAIREWGILTDENKRSLILFCLCYVMEHASATEAYVQTKVSAVAAQLIKRGWQDFAYAEKVAIFSEVKQAILGIHGVDAQFSGINFLESLVSEFSLSTSTAMGLPSEFHEQCLSSLELNYLKEFYSWAKEAALSVTAKIAGPGATVLEDKVCSAALRLMFQILNWNFKHTSIALDSSAISSSSGIRLDTALLKKFERQLIQPGLAWHDTLISSGHTAWLLNLYATLRQKHSVDVIWLDSPLAVSARQLIVQLCSVTGTIFPSAEDNGQMQIKHMLQILSAIIQWVEPQDAISEAFNSGRSGSEVVDACHALLSFATLTTTMLFDNLLRSLRPFGTLHLLSTLTGEVVKANAMDYNEEETWTSEALDILLETWSVILGRADTDNNTLSVEGLTAAANLFNVIVESHLHAAAESAFEDDDDCSHFHASVSKRDELLGSYALIARVTADTAIPLLIKLFSERVALLNQIHGGSDPTRTLEELYWLLLISGHVLTDSGEGETVLVPAVLLVKFSEIMEEAHHPVVALSWLILNFARLCLDSESRTSFFSPRLMEAVVWFLARWVDTYLMPLDVTRGQIDITGQGGQPNGPQLSKRVIFNFAGENDQGKLVVDLIIRISVITLTSYPGENELQTLSCRKLLGALVRRKNVCVHLVGSGSWCDLAKSFANEKSLLSVTARLQRSLAEILICAASGFKDLEASNQYVRELMGPAATHLVDISSRKDLKSVAQQADAIHVVCCLLERLRGAARATQPRTQKAIFEMGLFIMNPLLTLLEVYKNQSAVIYLLLKFVVDFVDGQVAFLNAKDTSTLVSFCIRLLQIYSSHNIGKMSVSLSTSLCNEAYAEKYKDLRALLQLLTNICSKDLVDFSSGSDEKDSPDIAEVIYVGFHIVTPLITPDLLKYPKLCRDYFALVSHILEVYPEKVAQLNKESFAQIVGTVDFGIQHQDTDVVSMCLGAVSALASYHYKERIAGKEGLGAHVVSSQQSNGESHENILRHFLQLLLHLLLFEDFRIELAGSVADALFPLLLCEQDLYQRLVQELVERQLTVELKTRLANALHSLTSSNQLSSSLDRANRQKFRKNLLTFLTEVSGFMRIR